MLWHLLDRGGALNFADTKKLLAKRDREWNINKHPQIYFNRVEIAMKSLAWNEINSDLNKQRDMTLYYLNATGEYDAAVHNGSRNLQPAKHGQTLKLSSQQNTQKRTNKSTHRKAILSKCNPRAGQSNGGTNCHPRGRPHPTDGKPSQIHNWSYERDDAITQRKQKLQHQCNEWGEKQKETRKTKVI